MITRREPELSGKRIILKTGREPGLPRLYRQQLEGLMLSELLSMMKMRPDGACILRLFACDCARLALQRTDNPDPRVIDAIRVARRYALRKETPEKLAIACRAVRDIYHIELWRPGYWAAYNDAERSPGWPPENTAHLAAHWSAQSAQYGVTAHLVDPGAAWEIRRGVRVGQRWRAIQYLRGEVSSERTE